MEVQARTGLDLVRGFANSTVNIITIVNDICISETDWQSLANVTGLPYLLTRNLTIRGSAGPPRPWVLDYAYAFGKVRLSRGVTLITSNVILLRFRHQMQYQAPGLDIISDQLAATTTTAAEFRLEDLDQPGTPHNSLRNVVFQPRACFPKSVLEESIDKLPRPALLPGPQRLLPTVTQTSCRNDSSAPPLERCWPQRSLLIDITTYGLDVNRVTGRTIYSYYTTQAINTTVLCEGAMSEECARTLGPLVCFWNIMGNASSPDEPGQCGGGGGGGPAPAVAAQAGAAGSESGAPPSSTSSSPARKLVAVIVGSVAACAVLALVCWAAVAYLRRRRRHRLIAGGKQPGKANGAPPATAAAAASAAGDACGDAASGPSQSPTKPSTAGSGGGDGGEARTQAPPQVLLELRRLCRCPVGGQQPEKRQRETPEPLEPSAHEGRQQGQQGQQGRKQKQKQKAGGAQEPRRVSDLVWATLSAPAPQRCLCSSGATSAPADEGAGRALTAVRSRDGQSSCGGGGATSQSVRVTILDPSALSESGGGAAAAARCIGAAAPPPEAREAEAVSHSGLGAIPAAAATATARPCPPSAAATAAGVDDPFDRRRLVTLATPLLPGLQHLPLEGPQLWDLMMQQQPQQHQPRVGVRVGIDTQPPQEPPQEPRRDDDDDDEVRLVPGEVLGRGAQGRVVAGVFRGQPVAVKIVGEIWMPTAAAGGGGGGGSGGDVRPAEDHGGTYAATLDALISEVEVLGRCEHPNVVRLLAACVTPPRLCLVMERMETSLDRLLYGGCSTTAGGYGGGKEPRDGDGGEAPAGRAGELLPLSKVLHITLQVALALGYLHPTIVHRDLKPQNVLLNCPRAPEPVVKLSDFGISRLLSSSVVVTLVPEAGTTAYLAPECFDANNFAIDCKADMYGWACLTYEMLSGHPPWSGCSPAVTACNVALRNLRPDLAGVPSERRPPRLAAAINRCWDRDPRKRLAAAEVVKELVLQQQALARVPSSG